MIPGRRVVLTLDAEADCGGIPGCRRSYESFGLLPRVRQELEERGVPLTAFVEGRILDERPDLVEDLLANNVVLECHGYDHNQVQSSAEDRLDNLERGLDSYERFFGKAPRGYRSPQGRISNRELSRLSARGVHYDSSVFPCYFPGRFNNFWAPLEPFRHRDSGLLELPLGALKGSRYPIGLSFIQLLGWGPYRWLFRISAKPECFILNFHLHDLCRGNWLTPDNQPSRTMYYAYRWALRGDPFKPFLSFLDSLLAGGYEATTTHGWIESLEIDELPAHELEGARGLAETAAEG